MNTTQLEKDLQQLINKHCLENGSDTPDFLLVEYIVNSLAVLNHAVNKRENWYSRFNNSITGEKRTNIDDPLKVPKLYPSVEDPEFKVRQLLENEGAYEITKYVAKWIHEDLAPTLPEERPELKERFIAIADEMSQLADKMLV